MRRKVGVEYDPRIQASCVLFVNRIRNKISLRMLLPDHERRAINVFLVSNVRVVQVPVMLIVVRRLEHTAVAATHPNKGVPNHEGLI